MISTSDLPLPKSPRRGDELTELARQARLVLEVVPGERRLLAAFGCRVHLVPLASASSREVGGALVEEALERWAPHLRVERAEVSAPHDGRVAVRLKRGGEWHALSIAHRFAGASGSNGEEPRVP